MMKQNDVSQMPIVSYGSPIGSISENKILSILIENDDAMNSKVVAFMERPFPVCQPDATISELSGKLQKSATGILIALSDGRLQLLTKSDLIDALTHK
jgi:predicted transcriptional regulator